MFDTFKRSTVRHFYSNQDSKIVINGNKVDWKKVPDLETVILSLVLIEKATCSPKKHKNIQTKKLFELNTEQIQWAKKQQDLYHSSNYKPRQHTQIYKQNAKELKYICLHFVY